MKRYLLFCFDQEYPSGGWNDFRGSYDTAEEASSNATHDCQVPMRCGGISTQKVTDHHHVVDSSTGEVIDGKALRLREGKP